MGGGEGAGTEGEGDNLLNLHCEGLLELSKMCLSHAPLFMLPLTRGGVLKVGRV